MSEKARSFYVPQLDALRFLAFLMVFATHALPHGAESYGPLGPLPALIVRSGAFGVDLFFVLSSYLITTLLLREIAQTGRLHIKAFYMRRVLRIWPLFFGFILLASILTPALSLEETNWAFIAGLLAFAGNLVLAITATGPHVLGPLWSLCLEEQFYLVWPPLVKRITVMGLRKIALGMLLVAIACRVIFAELQLPDISLWTFTLTRMDGIAAGILLATAPPLRINAWLGVLLGLAGIVAAEGMNMAFGALNGAVLGYTLAAGAGALVVGSAMRLPTPPGFLIYLGRISFGLYVFHALFIRIGLIYLPSDILAVQLGRVILAFAATIAAAAISYEFYEKPFLKWKRAFEVVPSRPDGGAEAAEVIEDRGDNGERAKPAPVN